MHTVLLFRNIAWLSIINDVSVVLVVECIGTFIKEEVGGSFTKTKNSSRFEFESDFHIIFHYNERFADCRHELPSSVVTIVEAHSKCALGSEVEAEVVEEEAVGIVFVEVTALELRWNFIVCMLCVRA
jgi:hypothetical protein